MKVEVTTAGKQAQSYLNVPAAIYVVTAEQIRRSGATTIPEAIRLVPGVQVAQISADQFQVSIRGFSSEYNDKLLVMIDGRSVYNTTFSGVYWDNQAINIDDIDRIEVIRGPGGSLWGSNAVNGIINVITKKSSDTQGSLVTLASSTLSAYEATVRYGGRFGSNGTFRVFGKALNDNSLDSSDLNDGWKDLRGGFRADWITPRDALMLSGSANSEHVGHNWGQPIYSPPYSQTTATRVPVSDANILANWQKTSGPGKGAEMQLYYSHDRRDDPGIGENHETLSADFKVPISLSTSNRLTVGAGYRTTRDTYQSGFYVQLPGQFNEDLLSAYLHDEWKLRPDLMFAFGARMEHNPFTGWEFQPSASLAWNSSQRSTLWAAVSRAVRTPSVVDQRSNIVSGVVPGPGTLYIIDLIGSSSFVSEVEISNEVGWRYSPSDRFLVDATAFYNQYTQLRSFEAGTPYMNALGTVLPQSFANDMSAVTAGFELSGKLKVTRDWQLEPSYTLFSEHFYFPSGVVDFDGIFAAERDGTTPRNQFGLRSLLNLPHKLEFDTSLSYTQGVVVNQIAPYARVDARLGWRPNATTEISLGGQNLFATNHMEALNVFTVPDTIQRNFFVKVTFRF